MVARPPSNRLLESIPLYLQIQESLLQRLSAGEWRPGDFLPSEIALAEQYKVSQGTIRKAMNALTRERVLMRHQGKGTSVAQLNASTVMYRFFNMTDECGEQVFPESTVLGASEGVADEEERQALGLNAHITVIRIERVRMIRNEPVLHERISLPRTLFPDFSLRVQDIANALYEQYAKEYKRNIVRVTEHVQAVLAHEVDAERLGVRIGSPLLKVTRISLSLQDSRVEYRVSRVCTDTYRYRAILS